MLTIACVFSLTVLLVIIVVMKHIDGFRKDGVFASIMLAIVIFAASATGAVIFNLWRVYDGSR